MHTVRRLNDHFSPEHYDLSLAIDRQSRTFKGRVLLHGTTVSDGSLWLHAKDLSVNSCHVDGNAVGHIAGENDEIELKVDSTAGTSHVITVDFEGVITDQMHGMYPCYFEHDGVRKELIATQFESHHAREVFPCIDEPAAKATYDVTLTTEKGIVTLGNMPIKLQMEKDDRMVTSFERTPKMSSYLLAWVTGELHKKSATTSTGVEVNVWATPAQPPESLDFALDIATRTIEFFDDYFGIPYPLPKCDHVALPDFSSGAMENWGLITYREVALLADPRSTGVSSKHRIAAVIAHELSHQWFGNLVTMKWWNNLWLNESFANLMEYIALDSLQPEWNVWFEFASYETVISLRRDATPGVQAVQVDVDHPDEISTLFDPAIVYAKGSRLLRMLERYIGPDAFREGLRIYFKEHAYGSTAETDLWAALSASSGQDIARVMTAWISQPGYPVLHVTKDGLSQEQFFIGEHEPSVATWPIPLGSNSDDLPKLLDSVRLEMPISPTVRLNVDDSAHFITHYPEVMLRTQLDSIRDGTLGPVERLRLLHEQTLLARGRLIESASLVPLLDVYNGESIESVWDIMSVALGELKKFVESDEPGETALRERAGRLALIQYERLGWEIQPGEPETDTKLRATVLGLMMYAQDQDVLRRTHELANGDIMAIDPEIRSLVLGTSIRHSEGHELFERLLTTYGSTSSGELQQDICSALTSTKDTVQIDRLLRLLSDPETIRSQDVARWFVYLIRNRFSRDQAWRWVRDNWQWIESTFAGDKSYDDYPRYAANGLMTRGQLDDYKEFFLPLKDQKSLTRVIDMGISEITARVELIEHDAPKVRAVLLNEQ